VTPVYGALVAVPVRRARPGQVREGRGGTRSQGATIPQEVIDRIVDLTQHAKPDGETHWSTRTMADRVGVSKYTVQRSGRLGG